MDQKFHGDDEKPENLDFETWPNVPKFWHDGILSIGNFMMMINNHFALFQLPGNLFKTKKVLPIFVATHNFLFILFFFSKQIKALEIFSKRLWKNHDEKPKSVIFSNFDSISGPWSHET
jgi:hypothetical protein